MTMKIVKIAVAAVVLVAAGYASQPLWQTATQAEPAKPMQTVMNEHELNVLARYDELVSMTAAEGSCPFMIPSQAWRFVAMKDGKKVRGVYCYTRRGYDGPIPMGDDPKSVAFRESIKDYANVSTLIMPLD